MGATSKKAPPLPAPTEDESVITAAPTELTSTTTTDVSKPNDEKSSYSLPEDGTPVTIKTRSHHKANKSQTSLLIEYFEGGKTTVSGGTSGTSSVDRDRKPSVRVRLTPSGKSHKHDRIQITETKSTSGRKASLTKKRASSSTPTGTHGAHTEDMSALSRGDGEDAHSMNSYASATEESNVSRNPIEVEIDRGDHRRRRRPASPLIPAADKAPYQPGNMSEISAIPTDSFLDGSGPSTRIEGRTNSKSPSKTKEALATAAAGLAGAAVADKIRSKSRTDVRDKDRIVLPKTREKDRSGKVRSKSRTSSLSEQRTDGSKSGRRRSSKGHEESNVSALDSSVVSSGLTNRSFDQSSVRSGVSKSSINNPKLLETVEDAIRRLILPELNALKREQSKRGDRRSSVTSSGTSVSRDDYDRRHSGGRPIATATTTTTTKSRDTSRARDREARHELVESPAPSIGHESVDESIHEVHGTPHKGFGKELEAGAAGAALGGLASKVFKDNSPTIARDMRRRRRAEAAGRTSHRFAEDHEDYHEPSPPMPLMSEVGPSDVTRTSILSAESDGPHSASEEITPLREVIHGQHSVESMSAESNPTPTRTPVNLHNALGTQHANISRGDLRKLSLKRGLSAEEPVASETYGHRAPPHIEDTDEPPYDDDYDDEEEEAYDRYYQTQDVPAPLKYVPYQPEQRGLSPIPSVSGYTEGGSEVHNRDRDSRLSYGASEVPSPEKSLRRGVETTSVLTEGDDFDEHGSPRSSGLTNRHTAYTEDSDIGSGRLASSHTVRAVGANPNLVQHSGSAVESHVASLIDPSILSESHINGESGHTGRHYEPENSMATVDEYETEREGQRTPTSRSMDNQRSLAHEQRGPSSYSSGSASGHSREYEQYDVDQYGRKVPIEKYRESPTASEAAITGAAVGAAAAALRAAALGKSVQHEENYDTYHHNDDYRSQTPRANSQHNGDEPEHDYVSQGDGVQRNKSFRDRTQGNFRLRDTPTHSIDRLDDYNKTEFTHSGVPDVNDPLPEIGYGHHDDTRTMSSASVMSNRHSASQEVEHVRQEGGARTPTQRSFEHQKEIQRKPVPSEHHLGMDAAAGAAALATAAALIHEHERHPSQDRDEDWRRTSEDRKRDTLITNPYEGTSPIANLPGLTTDILAGGPPPPFGATHGYNTNNFGTASPLGPKIDEGYISQGPNRTPDLHIKGKGIDYGGVVVPIGMEDPFYNPRDPGGLSGMSQGMASPMYDAATGAGIDRIESKDIVALMQHLMVRDAQRSARDTEILVTLVRTAAEMRNSFDDIKKQLVEVEDVVITEVKDNTEKTVQKHISGPRPFPGSAGRSIQGSASQVGLDQEKKSRGLWKRALKGLSTKGTNDLDRIEDMMMQLLNDVDNLKTQNGPVENKLTHLINEVDSLKGKQGNETTMQREITASSTDLPAMQYEQDRGYEPEGHAGTSTASQASRSGHLSIPRNSSAKLGYDRKFSDHRISTVPEDNEDEDYYQSPSGAVRTTGDDNQDSFLSPEHHEPPRISSVPLGSPSQPIAALPQHQQQSVSNDNTPRTDKDNKGKRHKSSNSSSWFPKISRWSATTASSVGKAFRPSKEVDNTEFHAPPSRSASNLGNYEEEYPVTDPYGQDKLHTGFSETNLHDQGRPDTGVADSLTTTGSPFRHPSGLDQDPSQYPTMRMTPEDPKYKAHRDSVNLQHPQPRAGKSDQFRTNLEESAHEFDSPMSPKSADWAGSATSLHRFGAAAQPQGQRYSNGSTDNQYWGVSSSPQGPPRPPKEPLDDAALTAAGQTTPSKGKRLSKLSKASPGGGSPSYHPGQSGSPKPENRNLNAALGVPTRRPSGPRAMTPRSPAGSVGSNAGGGGVVDESTHRKNRDTFGTVASQESETF